MRIRDQVAAPVAIAAVSLFIVVFDNDPFWKSVLRATMLDDHQGAILLAMFTIMFCTLNILLSLAVGTRALKTTAIFLLLVSATIGFFMSEYGIVVDVSMIRNVVETEVREASPLVTSSFFYHLLAFGVAPALVLAITPLGNVRWKGRLATGAILIAANALVLAGTLYANYGAVSFFAHQHHAARMLMNPGYPLYSYARFLARADDGAPDRAVRIALAAERTTTLARHDKPVLTVFVLGETARSDRFSFNGYERDTNRYTRARGVLNFSHVTSCGTSTADSVPCIFSGLGRAAFSHAAAAAHESLFLTLERLGVDVYWKDNSTGCKAVCDPEHFEQLATRTDAGHCDSTGCFDEILLEDIETLVADRTRDHFIVLHQRGSHGPAYHTDAPAWSKVFLPECDLPNLRNCSAELINNAYDNTIVYTDFFVASVIDFLQSQADAFDVAMLYVSDHGESLGENGLYLHGFPYAFAPQEQVRVPMLLWASPGFYARAGVERSCLEKVANRDYSHDSLFHTLLAIYDVESPAYRRELDLLADCKHGPSMLARVALRSRPRETVEAKIVGTR